MHHTHSRGVGPVARATTAAPGWGCCVGLLELRACGMCSRGRTGPRTMDPGAPGPGPGPAGRTARMISRAEDLRRKSLARSSPGSPCWLPGSLAAGGSTARSHARAPSRSEDEGCGGPCALARAGKYSTTALAATSRQEGTAYGVRSVYRRNRDYSADVGRHPRSGLGIRYSMHEAGGSAPSCKKPRPISQSLRRRNGASRRHNRPRNKHVSCFARRCVGVWS